MRAVACPVVRVVVAPRRRKDTRRKSSDASAAVRPARQSAMSSSRRARGAPAVAADGASAASAASAPAPFTRADLALLLRAVELSAGSDGLTQPHPKSGCVLVAADGAVVAETFQMGQGGTRAERLAERAAKGKAKGGVAYLNLEPVHGPVAGERDAVQALLDAGVRRAEIGVAHPVAGLRGVAVEALRAEGVQVRVHGDVRDVRTDDGRNDVSADVSDDSVSEASLSRRAASAARRANRALLYRCATGLPFSVLKYAMTLDGKIATTKGHSAWVTGPVARGEVWRERARSDAVIVGARTVRRDNPNLTTRREGGHRPARVVLSRSMDLPGLGEANFGLGTGDEGDDEPFKPNGAPKTNLWDASEAPTIVMTVSGTRPAFQAALRGAGVEVIEFDELTPEAVARYCAKRGFLQLFWECGGGLAAPALKNGVVHHVMAFVAPKIVGTAGGPAPTPVGETGFEEMTDALQLRGVELSTHGKDVLISGYVPARATTGALRETFGGAADDADAADPWTDEPLADAEAAAAAVAAAASATNAGEDGRVRFYKSWDRNGALSNFSPHPVRMPRAWGEGGEETSWPTVEHFYQAQKFSGVADPAAVDAMERIRAASAPEEAARIGRTLQRARPELIRGDWNEVKLEVMRAAIRAKVDAHPAAAALLRSTGDAEVVEDSPHDAVWGVGRNGDGTNLLGKTFMALRDEMMED